EIKGVGIGVPRRLFTENCEKEILAAFVATVTQMATLGAEVSEVESHTFGELWAVFWPILCADAAAYHLEDLKKRPDDYNPDLRLTLRRRCARQRHRLRPSAARARTDPPAHAAAIRNHRPVHVARHRLHASTDSCRGLHRHVPDCRRLLHLYAALQPDRVPSPSAALRV